MPLRGRAAVGRVHRRRRPAEGDEYAAADPLADPLAEDGAQSIHPPPLPPPDDPTPEERLLQDVLDVVEWMPDAMEDAKRAKAGRILEEKGHVTRLDEFRYEVAPIGYGGRTPAARRNRRYSVLILPGLAYSCSCPDHKNRGGRIHCKHIHAAMSLADREAAEAEAEAEAHFAEDSIVAAMFRGAAEAGAGADEAAGRGKPAMARSAYAAYRCMIDGEGDAEAAGGGGAACGPQWRRRPAGGGGEREEGACEPLLLAKFDPSSCAYCDGGPAAKHGHRHNDRYDVQRYMCGSCGRTFSRNVGLGRRKASPEIVTQAVHMWLAGMSLPGVALWLEEFASIKVCHRTILNWAEAEIGAIEEYADGVLTPRVSDVWRTDEMCYSIRGVEQYAFWMIDDRTRFVLALQAAEHKGASDARPLFEHAAALAAVAAPAVLVSDGAANFHSAWRGMYRAKNFMQRATFHVRCIHSTRKDYNNNLTERFNGWIRDRTRTARGLKRIDSAMLRGLRVLHNFVRPHGGLGGITPARAAGIVVEKPNAALTLVQNAALRKLRHKAAA